VSDNNVFKDIMFGTIGYIFGKHEAKRRPLRMPAPFKPKIVITVPAWGLPLMAIAIGVAVYFKFSVIVNVIELLIMCGSFLIVVEMSRIVSRLRYRVNHMMNGIDEDDDRFGPWMDEEIKETEDVPAAVRGKSTMRKVNGDSSTRV
jgi:hypothetical protein